MERTLDVLVLGLGAVGSASLYQLSKCPLDVAGVDAFLPPHDQGSSHGQSRLTRQAIGEGACYTPLVLRSNDLWKELEAQTGRRLLFQHGGLIYGDTAAHQQIHGVNDFMQQTVTQAERFGIDHQILDSVAMRRRFPQFKVHPGDIGYFEPGAGHLLPDQCIQTQLDLAKKNGAAIRLGERVLELDDTGGRMRVRTNKGVYAANRILLTVGKQIVRFLPESHQRFFAVHPQLMGWYAPTNASIDISPSAMPVFIRLPSNDEPLVYGFPSIGGEPNLIKIASEQFKVTEDADGPPEQFTSAAIAHLNHAARLAVDVVPAPARTVTCAYTVTKDSHFIIDRHPAHPSVLIASACSGHGFKHSAAVGELLCEWVQDKSPFVDLTPFSFERFADG